MNKITRALAALTLAASSALLPTAAANAACYVPAKVQDGFKHRVNLDQTTGWHYASSARAADYILENPSTRTGYREAWLDTYAGCPRWYLMEVDTSRTS